ncbi:MAG: hypothetical protein ABIO76_08200, partial [Ginsengibacter sp.]
LLYLGNALFLCYIFLYLVIFSKKSGVSHTPAKAGLPFTFFGVIVSVILTIISIIIFAPGLFDIGSSGSTFKNAPATFLQHNTTGSIFMLFASAIVGNLIAGSFSSVLAAGLNKQSQVRGK